MKKLFALAIVAIALTSSVNAQKERVNKERKMHASAAKKNIAALNLTTTQKEEFKKINANFKTKVAAIKADDALTQGEAKKQLAALKDQRNKSINGLLTDEQKQMREQSMEKNKAERQKRSEERLNKMKTKLSLTDAQVAKIKEQQQISKSKIQAIKANTTLTQEQKKEQVKAIMQSQKTEMQTLLTPEQLELLKKRKG